MDPKERRVAIIPDFARRYDREVVRGISRYVQETGRWHLYVHEDPRHKITQLKQWRGDGVIANTDDPKVLETVKQMQVPVIGFGGGVRDPDIFFLSTDNDAIGRIAADHLIERGFTRFAYCGYARKRSNPWSSERAKSFGDAIQAAGFECSIYHAPRKQQTWSEILNEMSAWLRGLEKPLGLMAANDARARQVLEACREIDARVPDEIAVIGVDNDELICDLSVPPISSVIQGAERIGHEAAVILEQLMDKHQPGKERHFVVPPVGVATRQSTDILALEDKPVATAVRFIRENAERRIAVTDVVEQVDVSRATLETRFKEAIGRSIHAEIQRVQLQSVKKLLRETDLTIEKIARRTGFRYVQYLANVFRKHEGQTPGEYRSRIRRGEG